MHLMVPGRIISIAGPGVRPGIRAPAGAIFPGFAWRCPDRACQWCCAPSTPSPGSAKRGFCPFFNSCIYNLSFGEPGFPGDSDQSGPVRPGSMGWRGDCPSPDARSGASVPSNGNKGDLDIYFVLLPDPIPAGFRLFELILRRNRPPDFYKNHPESRSGPPACPDRAGRDRDSPLCSFAIYILFFLISRFSGSPENPAPFRAGFARPGGMEYPRIFIPVVPCAPMEIKGF